MVRRATGRAYSFPAGLGLSAAVSLGLTLLQTFLLARLVSTEVLAWENIGYGILLLLLLSSAAGAKTACMTIQRRKLLVCTLTAATYWGMLLLITALFFGGQYDGIGVSGLMILCGSAVVCIGELRTGEGKRLHLGKRKRKVRQLRIAG